MFIVTVPAGFPSPAEDYAEGPLDLNRYLIHHPAATFFVRVKGDSMAGAGIFSGDLLIVDRALNPVPGNVVIADDSRRERAQRLMAAVDALNRRFGAGTVHWAAEGLQQGWRLRSEWRSQRFTTRWDELLVVR